MKSFRLLLLIIVISAMVILAIFRIYNPNVELEVTNTKASSGTKVLRNQSIDSGFCGILHNKHDIKKFSKPIYDIELLQFTNDTENDKYFIVHNFDQWGLFSKISVAHPLLTLSIATNRKFLFYNRRIPPQKNWKWLIKSNGNDVPYRCQNRTGRHCFFKPHSNLNNTQIKNLLDTYINNTFILDRNQCSQLLLQKIGTIEKFKQLTDQYKIITFADNIYCFFAVFYNKNLTNELIKQKQWSNINYFEFNALIYSWFFLNLQSNIYDMIDRRVNDILFDRYKWKSVSNTLSFPIRGSDKCKEGGHQCITLSNFTSFIKKRHNLFHKSNITAVIVSSEDRSIINQIKSLNFSDKHKLQFIFNDYDSLPNTGNPYTMQSDANDDNDMFDLLLSMLTTLKLQLHSNYYIIQKQSNWLYGIWLLASSFNDCISAYSSSSIQYVTKKKCIHVFSNHNIMINGEDIHAENGCFRQAPCHTNIQQLRNALCSRGC